MSVGEAQTHAARSLPRVAWGLTVTIAAVLAVAWLITWLTASDYSALLMMQLRGAAPTETLWFLGLSGITMVAMMLPSALPMVATYRGLAATEAGTTEAGVRTALFSAGYFAVWTAFTALSLLALATLGFMGSMEGPLMYMPGVLLVTAGVYQLTRWKQFCLSHCRSPLGFVLGHWRSGRRGAIRMGLDHAAYCVGCCWLLMLVLFVAGAMSLLWMGVFSLLILTEKVWSKGEAFAKAAGIVSLVVGGTSLAFTALSP